MSFSFQIPKILKNFGMFITDPSNNEQFYAGRVEEVSLPKLSIKTQELETGGMDIPVELDMGMQKLDATLTLCEYDSAVIKQFGLTQFDPTSPISKVKLLGAVDDETGTLQQVKIVLEGLYTEVDMGSWKANEKQTLTVNMNVRRYELAIDGEQLVFIDTINMIRSIGGVDQLSNMRSTISSG